MTDYEFDYELALRNAWIEFLKEDNDTDSVEFTKNGDHAEFSKGLSTDPLLYAEIKKRAEAGEFIDIKMPDFSNVPTLKEKLGKMQAEHKEENKVNEENVEQATNVDDFERVDPASALGGLLNA